MYNIILIKISPYLRMVYYNCSVPIIFPDTRSSSPPKYLALIICNAVLPTTFTYAFFCAFSITRRIDLHTLAVLPSINISTSRINPCNHCRSLPCNILSYYVTFNQPIASNRLSSFTASTNSFFLASSYIFSISSNRVSICWNNIF
jgi:hypothetical protein